MAVPLSLVLFIAVPELLGSLVGQATRESLQNWFATLRKPSWEPPGPLFGIAWSVFYGIMGYSSWRVWAQGGWQAHQRALSLYVVQLALNLAWPLVFFNKKKLGEAQILNLAVLATATATAAAFYKVDALAGKLFLPYLAWLAFANALNAAVYKLNPHATTSVEDLSHEADMKNPGERGYGGAAPRPTASLAVMSSHCSARSRAHTVRICCGMRSSSRAPGRQVPHISEAATVRPQLAAPVGSLCVPRRPGCSARPGISKAMV